jgi:type IV secretion system protein VirD4
VIRYDRRLTPFIYVVAIPTLWLLCASLIWSGGTGTPYRVLGWWNATQWWRANWWTTLWIALGAAIPTVYLLLMGVGLFMFWRRRPRVRRRLNPNHRTLPTKPLPIQRGITDNHGHSEWRSIEDTKRRFSGPQFPHGGLAVGEAYRVDHDRSISGIEFDPSDKGTWGFGGKAELLIDPCTKGARAWHSAMFGPTGSGKSSELVTKALIWTGSSVIFDPTIELGPLLDRAMRRQRKRVFHIGLPDPSKAIRMTGFNVLAGFDTSHPDAEPQLRSIVARIYDEHAAAEAMEQIGKTDPFFGDMGRMLVTCLLAHLAWSAPEKIEISLATFAAGMATPEDDMISLLHKINANSPSIMARRQAGQLMQARALETFSGIYLNAVKGTEWLNSTRYADLVSVGDFDPRYLLLGNCSAFVNIDLRAIEIARVVPRVIIGGILDVIFAAEGHVHSLIALFIDEIDTLKRLQALKVVRDRGRHFKIVLHGLWQSPFQLRSTWGENEYRSWMEAFSWFGTTGIRATGFGKELSDALGGHGVLAYSEGNNQGQQTPFGLSLGTFSQGENVNVHEISHHLITASQMQQDLRADEMIVVPDTGMPIRCGRCFWWRRPEIVTELEQSPQENEQWQTPFRTHKKRFATPSQAAKNGPRHTGSRP